MIMLNQLIPNLATLIVTVRRNVFSSVLTTVMILLIIIAWSAKGNIASWIENNPTAEQKSERITRGVNSSRKINEAIKKDLVFLHADRVVIRQFNANKSLPLFITTYFATSAGVMYPTNQITLPTSYLSEVIDPMWKDSVHPKCVVIYSSNIKNPVFLDMLKEAGIMVLYMCPIVGIDGAPIGTIHASYLTLNKERPTEQIIFSKLSSTGNKVAGYLAEVVGPEKDVWYRQFLK